MVTVLVRSPKTSSWQQESHQRKANQLIDSGVYRTSLMEKQGKWIQPEVSRRSELKKSTDRGVPHRKRKPWSHWEDPDGKSKQVQEWK